ncbi:MAG: PadR family transcriptional regulator [Actinobacteria bacterium]|nr:PadR family transcriptional regulator [Actinomycetota bacterium]
MSTVELTPTSYVVLGLLALGGPATSYDLKQLVAGTVGHFWSFPHTQLYTEPRRLAALGLVDEEQEEGGRRRRTYTLTAAGRRELEAWLAEPVAGELEIRDVGLLQLFLHTGDDPASIARLAEVQAEAHRATLATYEEMAAAAEASGAPDTPQTAALRLGLAIERAYVTFWDDLG